MNKFIAVLGLTLASAFVTLPALAETVGECFDQQTVLDYYAPLSPFVVYQDDATLVIGAPVVSTFLESNFDDKGCLVTPQNELSGDQVLEKYPTADLNGPGN